MRSAVPSRASSRRVVAPVSMLALTLALVGCTAAGAPGPSGASRVLVSTPANPNRDIELYRDVRLATHTVKAPPADVWKALPAAYADVGLTGGPAIGQAQTFAAVVPSLRRQLAKVPLSRLLECGTTPSGLPAADVNLVRLQVTTAVVPHEAGAEIRTQVVARATSVENSSSTQECATTGTLEQRLAKAVDARLGGS